MDLFDKIVALTKRRGFIFQGSEIYGGLANTYDYGPMGVELMRNIKNLWWSTFVTKRADIYGLDSNILMSPKVWEASGHVANFAETMADCKKCQFRARGDHLVEDYSEKNKKEYVVESMKIDDLQQIINEEKIKCPKCGSFDWTPLRMFNNLFETHIGIVAGEKSLAYLRGEIAQGMFVNFKNVIDSIHPKLPFGLAQSGSAFRNEITLGKLTFRTLQFNLAEFEYFFNPKEDKWEELYEYWKEQLFDFYVNSIGINKEKFRWREHLDNERAHYSKKTEDLEYQFPWGFKEIAAVAYRTDFDLRNHSEKSGVELTYLDAQNNKKILPHVIEPTFGIDRAMLTTLIDAYTEDEERVYLKLKPSLAPVKVAVFPLLSNKEELVNKAKEIHQLLQSKIDGKVVFDGRGNIGKRYFSQDEIGTPFCVTVDFDTLKDNTVTVRDRDTAKQERIGVDPDQIGVDTLISYLQNRLV